jgi:hypothetical protein
MAHNFFERTQKLGLKQELKTHCVDVGGEQFHASAVAFIDSFKQSTHAHAHVHAPSLKKILERFYRHFPKYSSIANSSFLTPFERMGMLINNARKTEIVECMAYVLRQIVIDEIYSSPLNYRDVFADLTQGISKNCLRQPTKSLPANIFGLALSQALAVTVTLSVIEHERELRKLEIYTNNAIKDSKLEVKLQVQGSYYFPEVRNPADFVYVGQIAVKPPQPVEISETETLDDIIDLVIADNQTLLRVYSQWRQNLLTMTQLGELTTSDLMALYISFLPEKTGNIADLDKFFARLSEEWRKPVEVKGFFESTMDKSKLYANSLAGWISTGLVDSEEISDSIEKLSSHTASPAA